MEPTVDYEELERLEKAVTPREWRVVNTNDGIVIASSAEPGYFIKITGSCRQAYGRIGASNAAFIAASRRAVPALLSERRKLHRALEIATEALECRAVTPGYECDERSRCVPCAAREAVKRAMEQED